MTASPRSGERDAGLLALRLGGHAGRGDAQGEKGATLAQKLGQRQPFYSRIPTGMYGPTCISWANLTPFSLRRCGPLERPHR